MNITIIGVGAMGCLFAAKLAPVAHVNMIGHWPEQLATLQQQGLRLQRPNGRFTHHAIHATNNPQDVRLTDVVLILVKSWQTAQAATIAAQVLADNGIALTLQNGLGNLEQLTAVLPPHRTTLGITSEGATITQPGQVRHAGHGQTHLAQGNTDGKIISQLTKTLDQAGFSVQMSNQVDSLLWGKLAINAGINPLTALLHKPNGFLAENQQARALMVATAEEAAAVANAQQIQLPYANVAEHVQAVATATAANHSSMLQDVLRGAPTEIEAICGAVVEYGRQFNIPTPINQNLLNLVKSSPKKPLTIEQLYTSTGINN